MMFLAAIQTKLEPQAYATSADFAVWIFEQTSKALATRDSAVPALIAFPELIGLPLVFFLERQTTATRVQDVALELLHANWHEALRLSVRHRHLAISSLLLPKAVQLHQIMLLAFGTAAKAHNAYIVAGSSFLPFVDDEAALGQHLANARVQNVSFLFAPSGKLLSRSAKINLTKGLERRLGLQPARLEAWQPTQTKLGLVGTLICYDGFFDSCITKADAAGTQILVQPSANAAKWYGAWSADPSRTEGQEWLARGTTSRIQGCEHLQVVINPMLVGNLFDLDFEGCSSIGFNGGRETILADSHDDFAVIATSY